MLPFAVSCVYIYMETVEFNFVMKNESAMLKGLANSTNTKKRQLEGKKECLFKSFRIPSTTDYIPSSW